METIALLLLGLVIGTVVGWVLRARTTPVPAVAGEPPEVMAARHEAALAELRHQEGQARSEVLRREAEARAEIQADLAAAQASVEELRHALDAARTQHRELLSQHRTAQAEREKAESGQTQVLKTLTPVVEHLRTMQRKVDDLEKSRVAQHAELATQIKHTQRSVEESRKAADTLSSVLKNNAVRGAWGETQLRTLVESAGLLNRVDFELQASVDSDSGARRPDMVINLPGGKQMAIDAKAPYNSFMDAQRDGIEPELRQRLLVDHAKKVRGHVDTLSRKGYWTGLAVSPEFTVAFIPNEQLLNAALDVDPSLMEHAFGQGVVLATPTNLWGMLKTVAFTWKQEALTEDAQALFELGQVLYRRILKLAEHVDKLGRSIQRSVKDYNTFTGSLERSVLPAARKLNAAEPLEQLPAPAPIEEAPRALTSGDFEVVADLERDELPLEWNRIDAVDAEIVEQDRDAG
ncbi:DNA recombination protein RmuC [Nocardioides stalactiti]|uniref:DNA recombination protein RmuC n=1 Tax=Nocardioides stalactiti TaxID=2755356 RepID=UPI00160161B3|nr:DNA recombination protein RmuC [Nocardioides stalactiti]